ncbi:glycosyltransferase family 87 protein [Roseovarius indicus]|uniref:glycosyltransferase family 87 protein n=1 Tax=Roseovarius indicus TaxID=540747 RepID=UPI0032EBB87C
MTPNATADASLSVLDTRRGRQLCLMGALLTALLGVMLMLRDVAEISGSGLSSVSVDFYVFWAAAKLALQGLPLDAFDVDRIREIANVTQEGWMPWAYPPGFLLLVTPLGLLPFAPAWAAFMALSVAALALATRPFTAARPHLLLAIALAPAILPCLLVGQTSILWLAGLMAALAALHAEKPLLAGLFIGLLTLKPQLGLLLPVALIAAGQWRAILAAAVTAIALAAIPTALYGTAYWPEMLAMLDQHGTTVRGAIADLTLMISPYSALAALGVAEPAALTAQWALTALCALAVFAVWRRPATSFDLRAATLLSAIPLASPYLWHYESAFLAPAALFLLRDGVITPARPLTLLLGLAMWLSLGPSALALLQTGQADIFRPVFLPIALAAFLTCLWHALLRPRPLADPATHEQPQ